MKNKRHSDAAIKLHKARKDYSCYYNNINILKSTIAEIKFDPVERYRLREYYGRLSDCRYMVNVLEKEIRLCKEEIYKAQNSYSNRKKSVSTIKDIKRSNQKEFEAKFIVGDKVKIKLKLGKPRFGRILGIFYSETADPCAKYPDGFNTIVKKVRYGIILEDRNDPDGRELEARYYLAEDLELI